MESVTELNSKSFQSSPLVSNKDETNQHDLSGNAEEGGDSTSDEEKIKEIFCKIRDARDHINNYLYLLLFIAFTGLYMLVIYLQADASVAFQVSRAHAGLLPDGYSADSDFILNSIDELYDWMNISVVQTVWQEIECGDNHCDSPLETPSFGPNNSYGCSADCGTFRKLTTLRVIIETDFQTEEEMMNATWNLCQNFPQQFCWYENSQGFTQLQSKVDYNMDVPDGRWTFVMSGPYERIDVGIFLNSTLVTLLRGKTCLVPKEQDTFLTSYEVCRVECGTTYNCVLNYCPNISPEILSGQYLDCVRGCGDSAAVAPPVRNCTAQIYDSWGGAKKCKANLGNSTSSPKVPKVSSTAPLSKYKATLWEKLGPTESERIFNLGVAVQRAIFTVAKDECLVPKAKNLTLVRQYTAFLCTFFGGPLSNPSCKYNSTISGKQLTTEAEIFSEILQIHWKMGISKDEEYTMSTLFLWAVQSVYFMDENTIVAFGTRLRQLDEYIVKYKNKYGCTGAKGFFPVKWKGSGVSLFQKVPVGGTIKWIWEDDNPHSLLGSISTCKGNSSCTVDLQGFGSGDLILSRSVICNPNNVGSTGIDSLPVPCNLVNPSSSPPFSFSFSQKLPSSLPEMTELTFSSQRPGDTFRASVLLTGSNESSCQLEMLANGKCDSECNSAEYFFDGADCNCPRNEFGEAICSCPSGQILGDQGYCCHPSLPYFDFVVSTYTDNTEFDKNVLETNAEILGEGNVSLSRSVAKFNQVLVGLLIEQERKKGSTCKSAKTRFRDLSYTCFQGNSLENFGTAPQFLKTSSLFDKQYAKEVAQIYAQNSSFQNETFAFKKPNVLFGFYPTRLPGDDSPKFQYILDVNLQRTEVDALLSYFRDGFFFDYFTTFVHARLATFNVKARSFTLVDLKAKADGGGIFQVVCNVKSLKIEHYNMKFVSDRVRLLFEILFLIFLYCDVYLELRQMVRLWKAKKLSQYFNSFWNYVDILCIVSMVTGAILWAYNARAREEAVKISPVYNIYQTPTNSNTYFKLAENSNIAEAIELFDTLKKLSDFRSYYFSLQGINVFLMIIRILNFFNFHPRMGAITRTFIVAAPDLVHFFIVFILIFLAYVFYAHTVFGRLVDEFKSLSAAFNSCFRILTGRDSSTDYLFRLSGWEFLAGVLFWWSFVIIVVFVVLNLLIGIMSDAFAEVKNDPKSKNAKWVFDDFVDILRNSAKNCLPGRYSRAQQLRVLKDFHIGQLSMLEEEEEEEETPVIHLKDEVLHLEDVKRLLSKYIPTVQQSSDQLAYDIVEEVAAQEFQKPEGLDKDQSQEGIKQLEMKMEFFMSKVMTQMEEMMQEVKSLKESIKS